MALVRLAGWLPVAVALYAIIACSPKTGSSPYTPELEGLFEAVGAARPSTGRITGGLAYAPRGAIRRAEGGAVSVLREVLAASRVQRTPAALAAAGVAKLLAGRLDESVEILTEAVKLSPDDARIHSDLAAAYLARGDSEARRTDLIKALEHAGRAVVLDDRLLEGHFNYAQALQACHLREISVAEWRLYLERDPDSFWGREALEFLAKLTRPTPAEEWPSARRELLSAAVHGNTSGAMEIVRRYRDAARELGEQDLLTIWAQEVATAAGNRALAQAKVIGDLLAETGDPLLGAAVAAATNPAPSFRERSIEGHLAFARGLRKYEEGAYGAAIYDLQSATTAFRLGGSPMALWSAWFEAACEHQRLKLDRAEAILLPLIDPMMNGSAPSLRARALWLYGLGEMKRGHPHLAARYYREGRALFQRLGERANSMAVTALISEAMDFLGRHDEGWELRLEALSDSETVRSSARLYSLLDQAGYAALTQNLPYASMAFRSQVVTVAETWGSPVARADAYLRRGRTYLETGRNDEAKTDLSCVAMLLSKISDDSMRQRLRADLDLALAEQSLEDDPVRSRYLVYQATGFFQRSDLGLLLPSLRLVGAKASERMGDHKAAATERLAAIGELERRATSVRDPSNRARAWNLVDRAYRDLAQGLLLHDGPLSVLDYIEVAKARGPFGPLGGFSDHESPTAVEVSLRLPGRVTMVEYAVLDDYLVVGVLRRGRTPHAALVPVSRAMISEAVEDYVAIVRAGHGPRLLQEASERLWQWLFMSALDGMSYGDLLVIIPDGPLHGLPFGALVSPDARYLVERVSSTVAASRASFLLAAEREQAEKRDEELLLDALIVSDPMIDPEFRKEFQPLVYAESETNAVAELWPNDRLLANSGATVDAFVLNAPKAKMIHFSGHSRVNTRVPLFSALILAPNSNTKSNGELFAHEILTLSLRYTDLVVLASCESGKGTGTDMIGPMGLGQAFQLAGVPSVVASLWPVDDADAATVIIEFQRQYSSGETVANALRMAQLKLITGATVKDAPAADWAAYQVLGAGGFYP